MNDDVEGCGKAPLCGLVAVLGADAWASNQFTYLDIFSYIRMVLLQHVSIFYSEIHKIWGAIWESLALRASGVSLGLLSLLMNGLGSS